DAGVARRGPRGDRSATGSLARRQAAGEGPTRAIAPPGRRKPTLGPAAQQPRACRRRTARARHAYGRLDRIPLKRLPRQTAQRGQCDVANRLASRYGLSVDRLTPLPPCFGRVLDQRNQRLDEREVTRGASE